MEPNTNTNLFELQVDHEASSYLRDAARWAKFLAIVGFVICGIIVLVALFAGSMLATSFGAMGARGSTAMGAMVSVIYIIIALISFFPWLFLFNFASKMQVALRNNDQVQLNQSFKNLKSCYRFLGILMIIYLCFIALALIFGAIGAAFR
jgi:hypothetical protein